MTDMVDRVRYWLTQIALPVWASVGTDGVNGFVERLSLNGVPDLTAGKRIRVQARQIYVFSHAKLLGLMSDGDTVAANGYNFVMRHGFPDGVAAGVIHSLERDGTPRDTKRDTYDHAFLLFALSWFYRATGRTDVRETILALCDAIWTILKHPSSAGFVVDDQGSDVLHQNPHMHLFEALLAAYDATDEPIFLDRAREIFDLFRTRMFDPDLGVLREFYDADWRPAAGEAGRIIEPGHHAEWVWLLQWYATRTGDPLAPEAMRLFDFAERYGRPAGVLLCDELWTDGTVKKESTRSWPQTEAIKAHIAIAEARDKPVDGQIDTMVCELFQTFIDTAIPGGWIDWVDVDKTPLVSAVPASTFYHLFLSFSEYLRVRA